MKAIPLMLSAVFGPATALAAEAAEKTKAPAGPDSVATVGSLILGLVAVVGVILLCAWLVKRMQGLQGTTSQAMKILAVLPVGQRERVALIEVGHTQILLGITPQSIRTLHVFDEPVVDNSQGINSDFASRLQAMLNRGPLGQGKWTNRQGDQD
ncbi:flagellar biosynthetic protein FliO [Marinobacteraceae bacterium S3BR75-40.1]